MESSFAATHYVKNNILVGMNNDQENVLATALLYSTRNSSPIDSFTSALRLSLSNSAVDQC